LKESLQIDLYKGKFFKDPVYYQLKKIIKRYNRINLVSGKIGIGKTTSILRIINKKRAQNKTQAKVDMTVYFSFD
jgi:type II secretory ATPase GspE/PulE/Tfp pilus assembly ATPase PilB-like protein